MLERIGSDSNLGLRVTGGLTFGPKRLIRVKLVLVNLNPIKDTYIIRCFKNKSVRTNDHGGCGSGFGLYVSFIGLRLT